MIQTYNLTRTRYTRIRTKLCKVKTFFPKEQQRTAFRITKSRERKNEKQKNGAIDKATKNIGQHMTQKGRASTQVNILYKYT